MLLITIFLIFELRVLGSPHGRLHKLCLQILVLLYQLLHFLPGHLSKLCKLLQLVVLLLQIDDLLVDIILGPMVPHVQNVL